MSSLLHGDSDMLYTTFRGLGLQPSELFIALTAVLALILVEFAQGSVSIRDWTRRQPPVVRWACYYGLVGSILFFGAFNATQQFIYFQF
jgi:hypothetical protein